MPCSDLPAPKPRLTGGSLPPAEVPRADVEHLIAVSLHASNCGNATYAADIASADRAGHAMDAADICDALAERGWTVHRTTDRR